MPSATTRPPLIQALNPTTDLIEILPKGLPQTGGAYTTPAAIAGLAGGSTSFATIAALRLNTVNTNPVVNVQNYAKAGDFGGGIFVYNPLDTTTADNGGTIIVDAGNNRWYRQYSDLISVQWFGVVGDGVADDTVALQAVLNMLATGAAIRLPPGIYNISSPLSVTFNTALGNNWFGILGHGARIQSKIPGKTMPATALTASGSAVLHVASTSNINIGDAVSNQTKGGSRTVNSINPGSWVISKTSTTVTLNQNVGTAGVAQNDTLWFGSPMLTLISNTTVRFLFIQGLKFGGSGSAAWYTAEGHGLYMVAGSTSAFFYDMAFHACAFEGMGGNGVHFVNDIFESQFYSCFGQDCGGHGMVMENNSNQGGGVISAMKVFGGSWAQNAGVGVGLYAAAAPYDVAFNGCYFRNNGEWGLYAPNHFLLCTACGFENNWTSAGSFAAGNPAVFTQVEGCFIRCTATSNQYQTGLVQGFIQGGRALTLNGCEIDNEGTGSAMFLCNCTSGSHGCISLDNETAEILRGVATGCFGVLFGGTGAQLRLESSFDSGSIANAGTYSTASMAYYQTIDRMCEINLKDAADTNVNGSWRVLGLTEIQTIGTPNGCSLAFGSPGTYGTPLILTNSSGGAIDFVGSLRVMR